MTTLPSDGEVAAPSNLQAAVNENRVDLSWQDKSGNEDGFIVKRKLADPNASFTDITTLGSNITRYTDTQI